MDMSWRTQWNIALVALLGSCLLVVPAQAETAMATCQNLKAPLQARYDACAVVIQDKHSDEQAIGAAYKQRGNALLLAGQVDHALEDYERGIKANPKDPEIYLQRASAYYFQRKFKDAIRDLDQAIRLDDRNIPARTSRGTIYALIGQNDRAADDFDYLVKSNPNNVFVLNNRGNFLTGRRQFERAVADFDRAVQIEPNNPATLNNRCWARLRWMRELRTAEKDCDDALRLAPAFIPAYKSRALLMFRYGAFDDAVADYSRVLAKTPKDADALFARGTSLIKLGKKAAGEADIAAARAIDHDIDKHSAIYGVE